MAAATHISGGTSDIAPSASAAHAASDAQIRGNAITWPFVQKNWFSSLWILLIGWFPLPLPMILSFGWLLDAAGRRARRDPELLPKARNLPGMYGHGIVFWFMLAIYFVIPLMIFGVIFSAEVTLITEAINHWIADWLTNFFIQVINFVIGIVSLEPMALRPQQSFADLILHLITDYFSVVLALFIYLVIANALFLAGTMRFATTGKISSYFRIFKNLGLIMAHLPRFIWLLVLLLLLNLVLVLMLGAGPVGFFLAVTSGVWIAAYLIGHLAATLRDLKAID
jgi:hypothetical protein